MTAFDYSRPQATASRLIARFGQTGAIVRPTLGNGPAYDPGEPTDTSHACQMVVLDYDDGERDGTLIKYGDKKVLVSVSGLTIEPKLSDKVSVGGSSHEIMAIKPLNPGGTVVMYEIQIRH
jgi:hypothetical protein